MTISANANEIHDHFQQVLKWYDSVMEPMLEEHCRGYDTNGMQICANEKEDLEDRVRAYVIEGLLAALK
jgi:hypothetical protein